jgi:D-alanyl-D-alanine carboxypeptidase (penicillin-binding protein 5/6)
MIAKHGPFARSVSFLLVILCLAGLFSCGRGVPGAEAVPAQDLASGAYDSPILSDGGASSPPSLADSGLAQLSASGAGSAADSYAGDAAVLHAPVSYEAGQDSAGDADGAEAGGPAHIHDFMFVFTAAPTCTARGYSLYRCECGQTEKRDLTEPVGHDYQLQKTVNSTCMAAGYSVYACDCGSTRIGDYTLLEGHVFEIVREKEVTCTERGYRDYRCSCGYQYTGDVIEPLGHNFQKSKVVEPTCQDQGYTLYKCVCGLTEKRNFTPAGGHTMEKSKVVAATCMTQGYTIYKCKYCSYTEKKDYTSGGAHTYPITRKVTASATQKGYTVHICLCGKSYTDSSTAATGKTVTVPYKTQTIKIENAKTGFVYDKKNQIVYVKGGLSDELLPASITKLVTALVAYQYADDSLVITAGSELSQIPSSAYVSGFKKGDKGTLGQFMAAMLLPSACDAAYIIAQGVGRKIDPKATTDEAAVLVFIAEMNNYTRKNGLTGSIWKNPDGNQMTGHYTSMADLIRVAELCAKSSKVLKWTRTRSYTTTLQSGKTYTFNNINGMLTSVNDCIGLKTGYTVPAGYCLLSMYQYSGREMIIGVFGCPAASYRTSVSKTLYDIFHDR